MPTANPHNLSLEPAALAFAQATAEPPYLYDLGPDGGRKAVVEVQSSEIVKPEIHDDWVTIDSPHGAVRARIVRPMDAAGNLPVILYIHGAGWVFGNAHTHDRLVRDLAIGAHAAVVFPEYDRTPESKYPTQIEQIWAVASWIASEGTANLLDPSQTAIAGDSVGGNMAAALTLLAKERGSIAFTQQVLFYPVTDASFETDSYNSFADGYFLTKAGMQWFWDQYTTDAAERAQITASPNRASPDELSGLPPALVITGEADVLRDEGESYAAKLRAAGVPTIATRYGGVIHDFVMLNSLHDMPPARAAVAQAVAVLRAALHDADR